MADFTQDQLDLLNAAIAEGVLTVKYADKEVTYRSLTDMMRIRDLMKSELGITKGNGIQRTFAEFNKG